MRTSPGGRTTRELGQIGEELACDHLRKNGYILVERGFRMCRGEIDVVARDGDTLVFVEVKTRADEEFGRPEEAVTPAKQRQIRRIAQGYLVAKSLGEVPCRFDVVAILYRGPDDYRLEHFRDAF